MFIRKKPLYDGKIAIQICEGYRENGKVRQRVLRHVGSADTNDRENLDKLLQVATFLKGDLEKELAEKEAKSAPDLPLFSPLLEPEEVPASQLAEPSQQEEKQHLWVDLSELKEEARLIEGIHAIFGLTLDRLNLHPLFGRRHYDTLRELIMARIAWPSSKLRASENLLKHFNVDIPVEKMYRLMDLLEGQETAVQAALFNAFRPLIGEKVEVLFFDVTTLYFEAIEEDELRRFGFSKDQKTHLTQVVLALATTGDGLPVGYKLFPGNTAETSTLLQAITEWREVLCIEQITIVADRAMMNEPNIQALEESKLKYVIAAKLKLLPKPLQKAILSRDGEKIIFQDREDAIAVQEHLHEGRRLIVSHSTKRARKDARDREQILKKLRTRIGQKGTTKKLVTNRGYLSVITEEGNSKVKIDEEKVAAATKWDGLHGVITNIPEKDHTEILSLYRRLWTIEESFRINKYTLEMRPVYHYVSRRIRAHILICYITFAVCRYVQKRISMQYETMSIDQIRSSLIDVQYSVLKHKETECRYRLPSKMTMQARRIYAVFNIKRHGHITKMV
jgi:transposase